MKGAQDIGIRFSMGGKTGSTVDSQRLLAWCLEKYGWQKQNELVEALFLDNFQNERFIGDPTVLLDASKRVGIDDAAEVLGAYRWHIPQRLWICSYFLLSPPLSFSSIVWPWEGEGNEAVFLDEVMTQYQSYTVSPRRNVNARKVPPLILFLQQ